MCRRFEPAPDHWRSCYELYRNAFLCAALERNTYVAQVGARLRAVNGYHESQPFPLTLSLQQKAP